MIGQNGSREIEDIVLKTSEGGKQIQLTFWQLNFEGLELRVTQVLESLHKDTNR